MSSQFGQKSQIWDNLSARGGIPAPHIATSAKDPKPVPLPFLDILVSTAPVPKVRNPESKKLTSQPGASRGYGRQLTSSRNK